MNSKFYIIIPAIAFFLILSNAFFGHLIYGSPYGQDINKYSIYVHLQPDWKSYPGNILYDVTTVWSNSELDDRSESFFHDTSLDISNIDYNSNQLQYQHGKAFVKLSHEFSNCETSWKPALYRFAIDTVRNYFQYLQGMQLNTDPYVSILPNISNSQSQYVPYDLTSQGYAEFIPICTNKETTDYQYSVSINDKKIAFDVFFVPSEKQLENFLKDDGLFQFYSDVGCYGKNYQSFTGFCGNVGKGSGLLIVIPDDLSLSLTRVSVSLHEMTSY